MKAYLSGRALCSWLSGARRHLLCLQACLAEFQPGGRMSHLTLCSVWTPFPRSPSYCQSQLNFDTHKFKSVTGGVTNVPTCRLSTWRNIHPPQLKASSRSLRLVLVNTFSVDRELCTLNCENTGRVLRVNRMMIHNMYLSCRSMIIYTTAYAALSAPPFWNRIPLYKIPLYPVDTIKIGRLADRHYRPRMTWSMREYTTPLPFRSHSYSRS